jgi:hypothetical protein
MYMPYVGYRRKRPGRHRCLRRLQAGDGIHKLCLGLQHLHRSFAHRNRAAQRCGRGNSTFRHQCRQLRQAGDRTGEQGGGAGLLARSSRRRRHGDDRGRDQRAGVLLPKPPSRWKPRQTRRGGGWSKPGSLRHRRRRYPGTSRMAFASSFRPRGVHVCQAMAFLGLRCRCY